MFDNFNDFSRTSFVLQSGLEEELNLFKTNIEDDEKRKGWDYRCSLNEFPDIYASEAYLNSLKKNDVTKMADPAPLGFRRRPIETAKEKHDESFTTFDRSENATAGEPPKDGQSELEDLTPDSSFIFRMDEHEICVPTFNRPKPVGQKEKGAKQAEVGEQSGRSKSRSAPLERKPNGIKQKPLVQCNCKKSKCLRLYCECFAKGLICGVDCNCSDCHNNQDLKDLRELVVQETIEKNPYAFKSKYKKLNEQEKILHSRGCNCSKTGCVKKYCECFNAGTGCSRLCRCSNCKNESIEIKDVEVKMYYDRVLRKRKKRSVLDECFQKKCEIIKKLKQA